MRLAALAPAGPTCSEGRSPCETNDARRVPVTPRSRIFQVLVGGAAVVGALLLARAAWSGTAKMVAFVVLVMVVMIITRRFSPRLPPSGVEEAGPDAVMRGAEGFLSDFEVEGLRPIGSFRWNLRGRLVTETVLAPSDNESWAIVTDRVLDVASRFGERTLSTINGGRAQVPTDVLRQVIRRGSPADLVRAHRAALDLLARRGLQPDRFRDDADILAAVRATEERALRSAGEPSLLQLLRVAATGGDADRELGDDDESQRRIDAWLRSDPEHT